MKSTLSICINWAQDEKPKDEHPTTSEQVVKTHSIQRHRRHENKIHLDTSAQGMVQEQVKKSPGRIGFLSRGRKSS